MLLEVGEARTSSSAMPSLH